MYLFAEKFLFGFEQNQAKSKRFRAKSNLAYFGFEQNFCDWGGGLGGGSLIRASKWGDKDLADVCE